MQYRHVITTGWGIKSVMTIFAMHSQCAETRKNNKEIKGSLSVDCS